MAYRQKDLRPEASDGTAQAHPWPPEHAADKGGKQNANTLPKLQHGGSSIPGPVNQIPTFSAAPAVHPHTTRSTAAPPVEASITCPAPVSAVRVFLLRHPL